MFADEFADSERCFVGVRSERWFCNFEPYNIHHVFIFYNLRQSPKQRGVLAGKLGPPSQPPASCLSPNDDRQDFSS